MDVLETYRDKIEQLLIEYALFLNTDDLATCEPVFDRSQDRFLLVEIGWDNYSRICGTLLHLDIVNDTVWIQQDGTEEGVAGELMAVGIPQDRIVLAFQHPSRRKHGEFAAA